MNAPEKPANLAPEGAMAVPEEPIEHIAPSLTNGNRHTEDYIAELAESIRQVGIIQPITVRPWPESRGKAPKGVVYEVVVGEGRLLGAKKAGLTTIPFFWRDLSDLEALTLQLIENLKRKNLTPIHEAEGYRRLMQDHGLNAEDVAKTIGLEGMSRSYVYSKLKLLDLCDDGREALLDGSMDASIALLVARVPKALQKKALAQVLDYNGATMSFRMAKDYLKTNFAISLKQATFPLGDAKLVPLAGSCEDCSKRSGNDPAMVEEGIDTDVCTDTKCFDDKRAERHLQLIANAEKKKIPVLRGEAARDVAPSGLYSLDTTRYVRLDSAVPGDAEGRSYRQIIGAKTPIAALIELGNSERDRQLVELGEPTALELALKKAGFKLPEKKPERPITTAAAWPFPTGSQPHEETPEERAEREAEDEAAEAVHAREKAKTDAERDWRQTLATTALARIAEGPLDSAMTSRLVAMVAAGWVRKDAHYNALDQLLVKRHGFTLPDKFDEAEEIAKITEAMRDWPLSSSLCFLLDAVTQHEHSYLYDDAVSLPELATLLGFNPESMRKPLPTPYEAAQAREQGAPGTAGQDEPADESEEDGEEKTDPASASPTNEPASPAEDPAAPNVDLFPDAPEFSKPNECGVYPDDQAEALEWSSGKTHKVTLRVLQIAEGWIHSAHYDYRDGAASGPLSCNHCNPLPTRALAIADAASRARSFMLGDGGRNLTAAQKKSLGAWLDKIEKDCAE